jgi:hypothetical protein
MRDIYEIQRRHDEELRCAIMENQMNEFYEPQGITFYISYVRSFDGRMSTSVLDSPTKGDIYLSLKNASKILNELPPTSNLQSPHSITIIEDAVAIGWIHGILDIHIRIRHADLDKALNLECKDGVLWEADKIKEVINFIINYNQQ